LCAKMMKVVLFLALSVCVAIAVRDYKAEFQSWTRTHQKTYSVIELASRFNKWRHNLQYVEAHNSRADRNFTLAINKFADLSHEEFKSLYVSGLKMNVTAFRQMGKVFVPPKTTNVQDASWDWRQKGAVSHVKNQGQCGACWSFSTTGSTEGCNAIKSGTLPTLSEQNLVDCSSSYGNQGCDGGLMTSAMDYIIANNGLDSETGYPYEAKDGKCRFKSTDVKGTLSSYSNVASGDEGALATAGQKGPVSVAIDASQNSFQFYTSGVYYEPACSSTNLDHGVLMVGAGTESDGDYWIVKNSWGTDWGMSGYILMARNKNNNCGIATSATLPAC